MLISHRHRFLYFVVPKCASATIRKSLAEFSDVGWPVSNYQQHVPIDNFLESEEGGLANEYFKLTFVRNPYDRIYSGYLQDRYAADNYPRWTTVKKPIFDRIGDDFSTYFNEFVVPADAKRDWQWICFCPMYEFAQSTSGHIGVDFVGRAENVEQDLALLGERLGLPIRKATDENVRGQPCTTKPKYLDRYDSTTIQAVNELYERDFRQFGYPMLDPAGFPG
ncbi:sulfotransferase family 2 domain-containing protein [Lysobacter sp. F6437]|uniref:sulfotransferase family 2 domain-containing protein n=1 Tax=Lysobacter sp. F6437 TaxID=3459296 RepID=UPI00403D939D